MHWLLPICLTLFTCTGCLKTGPTLKQCILFSYWTCTNVNSCYWNTCKLLLLTHKYPESYSCQFESSPFCLSEHRWLVKVTGKGQTFVIVPLSRQGHRRGAQVHGTYQAVSHIPETFSAVAGAHLPTMNEWSKKYSVLTVFCITEGQRLARITALTDARIDNTHTRKHNCITV